MILSTNSFDPEEEEGRRRPSHVSRKEIIIILVALVVFGFAFYPFFQRFRRHALSERCVSNLQSIAHAIELYAAVNNDRLPPVYVVDEKGPYPKVFDDGNEFTWISLISNGMDRRASFKCPSSSDEEDVMNEGTEREGGKTVPIRSSYGMFGGLSAYPVSSVPQPGSVGLVADTSNLGNGDPTYDPLPFKDANGKLVPDAAVIGFDNTNFTMMDSQRALYRKARFVTRLAFPGSAKGPFGNDTGMRHDDGVHMITVDGHLQRLKPADAFVPHIGKNGDPGGWWAVPY